MRAGANIGAGETTTQTMGDDATASDRTGLLIIRAWTEPGSSEPLRAQVRLTTDVPAGFQHTLTVSRAEAVCDAVRVWLADILSETPAG
ncbi:MAG: hypothetical protein LC749_01710 [Actinobacteria bacterium]|nr:hypothetical protein [Actinomycetota bacterium]